MASLYKVRQKDLAKAANVSVATVSLALRDHPSISEATKKKVAEAQKRIGYYPRKNTWGGKAGDKPRLLFCLLRRALNNPLYNPFLEGVVEGCKRRKTQLDIDFLRVDEDLSRHSFQIPEGGRPNGVIFAGEVTEEVVRKAKAETEYIVVLGSHSLQEPVHRVELDLHEAALRMVRRAISDGNRNLLVVTIAAGDYNQRFEEAVKYAAFREGVSLPARSIFAVELGEKLSEGLDTVANAVARQKSGSTGIITSTSFLSEGLCARLSSGKVNHYTILADEIARPGIAGIDLDQRRLGLAGADLIHTLCSGEASYDKPYTILLPPGEWR